MVNIERLPLLSKTIRKTFSMGKMWSSKRCGKLKGWRLRKVSLYILNVLCEEIILIGKLTEPIRTAYNNFMYQLCWFWNTQSGNYKLIRFSTNLLILNSKNRHNNHWQSFFDRSANEVSHVFSKFTCRVYFD